VVAKSSTGCRGHGAHLDNASIIDHDIDAPKALRGLVHESVDLLLVGDVTGYGQDLGATLHPKTILCMAYQGRVIKEQVLYQNIACCAPVALSSPLAEEGHVLLPGPAPAHSVLSSHIWLAAHQDQPAARETPAALRAYGAEYSLLPAFLSK
jgi:hypothetical protein